MDQGWISKISFSLLACEGGRMTAFQRGNSRASKLSVSEVLAIRQAYTQTRVSQGALARKYQVSVITIGRIVRGETWQSVPMQASEMSEGELKDSADRLFAEQEGHGLGKLAEEAEEAFKSDGMVEEIKRGPLDE